MKVLDVLKYFLKNEYLTSTCTWYMFGYLVYLSTWSTVLDPNPDIDTALYIGSENSQKYVYTMK